MYNYPRPFAMTQQEELIYAVIQAINASESSGILSIVAGTDITVDNTDPQNPVVSATGGMTIVVVVNYSALPSASTVTGEFYWCQSSQGTAWLPGSLGGTYYSAGLYYSNGTTWETVDVPYQSTQAAVNTGTDNSTFVTPYTLNNSTQWNTKISTSLTSGYLLIGNASNIATPTAMSGDATVNYSGVLTLATVNSNVGTFNNFTVNAKGLITAASNVNYQSALSGTGFVKISGTTISYDNSTYLTTGTASSTYLPIASPAYTGSLTTGTLGYTDSGELAALQSSVAGYNQFIIQNTNSASNASTGFIVSNNLGTSTSYYGEFGMNSSAYTGSGCFNIANTVYLTSTNDLSIGTVGVGAIHFATNSASTDAITISSSNAVTINGNITLGTVTTGIWNAGAVTSTGSATALNFIATGTSGGGYGYLQVTPQTTIPRAVNGSLIITSDLSNRLMLIKRNIANSADINSILIFPDVSTTITFPTPASGGADTVAYLGTAQTFTAQNTFNNTSGTQIYSLQIYDQVATTWRTTLTSTASGSLSVGSGTGFTNVTIVPNLIFPNCYSNSIQGNTSGGNMIIGPSLYTGNLYLGAMAGTLSGANNGTVGSVNLITTSTSGTGAVPGINIYTGNQTNTSPGTINPVSIYTGNVTSGTSGSVLCDVGTGGTARGGWAFFNGQSTPVWNGLQRGIFIGNATANATGDPTGGFFLWSDSSGYARYREPSLGVNDYLLHGTSGASAPSTTALTAFTSYYGTGGTVGLSTPNSWASVKIGGTVYKIPLYT